MKEVGLVLVLKPRMLFYLQSRNRDTGVENKRVDTKGNRGWDELRD